MTANKARLIIIGLLILSVIYGIYDTYKGDKALKKYDLVIAQVTGRGPTRQGIFIYIRYKYNGKDIDNFISIREDTLKLGDHLLIEVSKGKPEEYIKFIRRR